jgi:hypothetical protein
VLTLATLAGLAACRPAAVARSATAPWPDSTRLRADVAWLASDAREGRGTGTAGADSAAAWLARFYRTGTFRPPFVDSSASCVQGAAGAPRTACAASFTQPFTARRTRRGSPTPIEAATRNVGALLPGTDPVLAREVVVVGAHYDHLGREIDFATDPEAKDQIRNGADDNASGTAGVLELARRFRDRPAKRSILFVHFGAEEWGLLGAAHLMAHLPVPPATIRAMVNFDMIGRLRGDSLIINGVGTAPEWREIITRANAPRPLTLALLPDGSGRSDHDRFFEAGIPVLHFFTNVHDDYHRASDDVERINADGMAKIVALAEGVIRDVADRPAALTFTRPPAPPPMAGSVAGSGAYLGSVPDMAAADIKGMRLSGVRDGSPADLGGLKAGDIIVEFGGVAVTDLYTYTDALRSRKPGDRVAIVVLRGGVRTTLSVVLGTRGG